MLNFLKALGSIGLSLFGVLVLAVILILPGKGPSTLPPDTDPRSGFASVQRLLIAQTIGVDRAWIVDWDRSPESVHLVSETEANVRGWYRNKIGGRLRYRAKVTYEPRSDLYRMVCFVLEDEVAEGRPSCI